MKNGEWFVKLLSFVICLAAVCFVSGERQKAAENELSAYIQNEKNEKTEVLYRALERLRSAVAGCSSDPESLIEVAYGARAASDAVSRIDATEKTEPLRAYFSRIETQCGETYRSGEEPDLSQRQALSELYVRLTAVLDSAAKGELIRLLSSGIVYNKTEEPPQKPSISRGRAEKLAYKAAGEGVRFDSRRVYGGGFVFSSDKSYIALDGDGRLRIKSKVKLAGKKKEDENSAKEKAAAHITKLTGMPSRAVPSGKIAGVYYFIVESDGKKYPVGIDDTDGSVIFELTAP